MISSFVLAALAAAQAAAPSSGVRWVPVDEARRAEAAQGADCSSARDPGASGRPAICDAGSASRSNLRAGTANAVLRVGTEIPLRLSQELTTKGKKLRVGDRFHLERPNRSSCRA